MSRVHTVQWRVTVCIINNSLPRLAIHKEWKPDYMRLSHSPYSSWILTKHYLWPESAYNRWNDFNRGINYCLIYTDWTACTWKFVHSFGIWPKLENYFKKQWWIMKQWQVILHQNHTQQNIVHYSAIFTANMSKINFRLFELFTIKSVIFF